MRNCFKQISKWQFNEIAYRYHKIPIKELVMYFVQSRVRSLVGRFNSYKRGGKDDITFYNGNGSTAPSSRKNSLYLKESNFLGSGLSHVLVRRWSPVAPLASLNTPTKIGSGVVFSIFTFLWMHLNFFQNVIYFSTHPRKQLWINLYYISNRHFPINLSNSYGLNVNFLQHFIMFKNQIFAYKLGATE